MARKKKRNLSVQLLSHEFKVGTEGSHLVRVLIKVGTWSSVTGHFILVTDRSVTRIKWS
jgi:hypothetical protein